MPSKFCIVACLLLGTILVLTCVLYENSLKDSWDITQDRYRNGARTVFRDIDEYQLDNGKYKFNMRMAYVSKFNTSKMDDKRHWKEAFYDIVADFQVKQLEYKGCTNKTWRGNWMDCNTHPFNVRIPCLVYSFGIGYDFSFDDAFAEHGCTVYSFDPSMTDTTEHIRLSGVRFFPIGLGNVSSDIFHPHFDSYTARNMSQIWKIRTLKDIMKWLGHENRALDVLKIDIEGYEWEALDAIIKDKLTDRIRQLDIEFHIFPDTQRKHFVNYLRIYQTFKNAGFRFHTKSIAAFSQEPIHFQADCNYVNLKYDLNIY